MTPDSPDYVLEVQTVIVVGTTPVPSQPAGEAAAGNTGRYAGTAQTYQALCSWTVTTGKVGELKEILVLSSNYAKTLVHIDIGSVEYCDGWTPQAALPLIFEDLKLAAGTVVSVTCKSSDGTSITVDGAITAKEIG